MQDTPATTVENLTSFQDNASELQTEPVESLDQVQIETTQPIPPQLSPDQSNTQNATLETNSMVNYLLQSCLKETNQNDYESSLLRPYC